MIALKRGTFPPAFVWWSLKCSPVDSLRSVNNLLGCKLFQVSAVEAFLFFSKSQIPVRHSSFYLETANGYNNSWSGLPHLCLCSPHLPLHLLLLPVTSLYTFSYPYLRLKVVYQNLIFPGRCLECTRVRIHKHLFVSFIINNVLWLIWYRAVVTQPDVLGNPINAVSPTWNWDRPGVIN